MRRCGIGSVDFDTSARPPFTRGQALTRVRLPLPPSPRHPVKAGAGLASRPGEKCRLTGLFGTRVLLGQGIGDRRLYRLRFQKLLVERLTPAPVRVIRQAGT